MRVGSASKLVVWGVVEWVERSTLRFFSYIERMGNEEFVKRVYLSSEHTGWSQCFQVYM